MAKTLLGFTNKNLYLSILPSDLQNELLLYLGNDIIVDSYNHFSRLGVSLNKKEWYVNCGEFLQEFISFLQSDTYAGSSRDPDFCKKMQPLDDLHPNFSRFLWLGSYPGSGHYTLLVFNKKNFTREIHLDAVYGSSKDIKCIVYNFVQSVMLCHKLNLLLIERTKFIDHFKTLKQKF